MADLRNYQSRTAPAAQGRSEAYIDQGLRAYMLRVYNLMALGLVITGIAAWGAFSFAVTPDGQLTQFGYLMFQSGLRWVVVLAPLALVFFLSFRINSMSVSAAQATVWAKHVHAAAGDVLAARWGRAGYLATEMLPELPLVLRSLGGD